MNVRRAVPVALVLAGALAVRSTLPLTAFREHPSSSMRRGATVTYLDAATGTTYGANPGTVPNRPDGVPTAVGLGTDFEYGSNRVTYTLGAPSRVAVNR